MRALLKSNGLSNNAIKIYLDGLGRIPYTFSEIQSILPNLSENDVRQILDELISKKLIIDINPKYSKSLPHYIIIPPIAILINSLSGSKDTSEENVTQNSKNNYSLEGFQEVIYQDFERITEDLIDTISKQDNSIQTTEILAEVENNIKKFAQVILNEVVELISPLKMQSIIDGRDLNKLIGLVKQKISESEEIVTNMFIQFREIVNDMTPSENISQIEGLKVFIRRLGESIEKRVGQISLGTDLGSLEKVKSIKSSMNNILKNYLSVYKVSTEKFWEIENNEKIKEIISILFEKCTNNLTIIVPNIEDFIPLEKLALDYSEDLEIKRKNTKKTNIPKKSGNKGHLITKKQKKDIEDKLDLTAKKVAELKGFELSHDIAEILSIISEVNPDSMALESIQGWLNRLLVIRKHLDSNTQYLLLENIEKWKGNFTKVKKKEKQAEEELIGALKEQISEGELSSIGLQIQIISSESHDNKHAKALLNITNIEYLQIKNNETIAIIGDNSYLMIGIYNQLNNKSTYEIGGFFTTYLPILKIFNPLIESIKNKAIYVKEIEINRGFNEIIENINDYTGKKISKKLKRLLDVAFKQDGISLDILELKLLVGKLEKYYHPLNDEIKEYVINELNKLNKKFTTMELIYPPEFRRPIIKAETKGELEAEVTPAEIEPLEPEKINNLFELLMDKIDELRGVEIGEQIDKFIEAILKLQGYSEIVEWKQSLRSLNETLEESFKEKIKKDLLSWKEGILQHSISSDRTTKEKSMGIDDQSQKIKSGQMIISSLYEEEYISPGMRQSQFGNEDESASTDDSEKSESGKEMRELFNMIEKNLGELSGTEISKKLQNIINNILENEGYSMALKEIKDWISKLRMIRAPLETEIKEDFELEFLKLKQKYIIEDDQTNLDLRPSFEKVEESVEESEKGGNLIEKFNNLLQATATYSGNKLSENLQVIADIVLQSYGAVAVNIIRQWISRLRSIKEPLEEPIKEEFLAEVEKWKEKFA